MPSNKNYLNFILDQLCELQDVNCRKMMGEYIIYYRNKVVGGIYDNRFLIKPTPSAKHLMPEARFELPYEGAKPMLLVDNLENSSFLKQLFIAIYDELPETKRKK